MAALLGVGLLGLGMSAVAQVLQDHTRHQQTPPPDQNHGPTKNAKRGARAIGVVEFLPGGGTRLVPIAIWIDDRFYDASLYAANPEPLAVEPQTVYQATDYGEPTGLFTVVTPKEVNGSWVADGKWTPHRAMDEMLAKQAAKQPKKKVTANADDDRPVLHRAGSSGSGDSGTPSGTSSNTPPPSNDDPDRPTLKNSSPSSASTPAAPASSGPTPADSAPKSGTQQASSSVSAPASANDTNENDPGRPLLRRGKPAPEPDQPEPPAQTSATKSAAATGTAQVKPVSTLAGSGHHSYPAVSDAGKYEMRSLLYAMGSSERVDRSQEMGELALDDIRKFVAQRKTPALPKTAAITDYDLRAFDLDYSNSPTLVYTATLAVPGAKALRGGGFDYYVTVVAREDINGKPIKIFSSVTDSNHLDAFARMEIIDAVDADANGRGDLLFRQYSDTGISYGLYRVYPYQMQKIFEGGSGV